ncbi:hypothetical protein [Ruegeria sp. HKCCA0235A]|uniref:hypothetical protein n=1 Tax=Ruegeria sp. HKCCA0235A TaxID=2682998 RepID=UPI00148915BC|nr:hypothetical protein [Ruegeria sp. HKCCA0235A]
MPIFEFASGSIQPLVKTTFNEAQLLERRDLQRLLRANVSVIAPDTLVIAEEFGDFDKSRRRIDLLGVDRNAKLVVIELKRTEDGGHMELQAVRYAAMVSSMTFDEAVEIFDGYLTQIGRVETNARAEMLEFLGWDEPDEDAFAQDVRIVLASAEFSRELTSSVMWLNDGGIDVSCVRLQPYMLDGRVLVDAQQIIPLPEAAQYQVRIATKKRKEREARSYDRDWTIFDVSLGDKKLKNLRKRHAIYQVVRYLLENEVTPDSIAEKCNRPVGIVFASVEGEVDADDFQILARASCEKEGRNFDPRRYFCGNDELLRIGGRTYAFTNQWGGPAFDAAMVNLRNSFPQNEIAFEPSAQ